MPVRHRTTRPRTSRPLPPSVASALPVALTAVLGAALLAGCTSGSDDAGAAVDGGSGPAQAEDHGSHGDHADAGKVPVGPLQLPGADYWSVLQPADGVTQVRAGGCPEDAACPSFEVLTGAALDGVDPASALLPDGATCPGTDALAARAVGDPAESDVEVAGTPATLARRALSCGDADAAARRTGGQLLGGGAARPARASRAGGAPAASAGEVAGSRGSLARWTLSCVDAAGAEVRTVEQLQWYVPDAPGGAVLVVDRWAFEGLESRLAAGGWASA